MRRGASVTVLRRSAMSWLMGGAPSATTAPRAGLRASAVMLVLGDDATKAVVGTAELQGGTPRNGALRGNDDDCVFSFSLTVPDRDAYRIEVGKRPGQVPFTRSDLEKSGWKADLTIGAYTMFGGI